MEFSERFHLPGPNYGSKTWKSGKSHPNCGSFKTVSEDEMGQFLKMKFIQTASVVHFEEKWNMNKLKSLVLYKRRGLDRPCFGMTVVVWHDNHTTTISYKSANKKKENDIQPNKQGGTKEETRNHQTKETSVDDDGRGLAVSRRLFKVSLASRVHSFNCCILAPYIS